MLRLLLIISCMFGSVSHAASSDGAGLGFNVGIGLPFLSQAGLDWRFSNTFGITAAYNALDISSGEASAKLTMPELLLNYHPFSGAFFIGVGIGKENLKVTAKDSTGVHEAKIEVEATTTVAKAGWKWGIANGGFWFGMDLAYIIPSSPKRTITAAGVPETDESYIDAVDVADRFGKQTYINLTFARFGFVF